jgi:hypothetical protein
MQQNNSITGKRESQKTRLKMRQFSNPIYFWIVVAAVVGGIVLAALNNPSAIQQDTAFLNQLSAVLMFTGLGILIGRLESEKTQYNTVESK